MDVHESIGLANGTSGNAVVFAGSTVIVALLALNITGIPFLGLMGTVGAACVAIAVLVAITLTPALLGLLGARVVSRRARAKWPAATTTTTPAVADVKPMSTAVPWSPCWSAPPPSRPGDPRAVDAARSARRLRPSRTAPRSSAPTRSSRTPSAPAATPRCWSSADLPEGLDEAGERPAQLAVARASSTSTASQRSHRSPSPTTAAGRLPGGTRRWPQQRVHRTARARAARPAARRRRPDARRRRARPAATSTSRTSSPMCCRCTWWSSSVCRC